MPPLVANSWRAARIAKIDGPEISGGVRPSSTSWRGLALRRHQYDPGSRVDQRALVGVVAVRFRSIFGRGQPAVDRRRASQLLLAFADAAARSLPCTRTPTDRENRPCQMEKPTSTADSSRRASQKKEKDRRPVFASCTKTAQTFINEIGAGHQIFSATSVFDCQISVLWDLVYSSRSDATRHGVAP